MPDTMSVITIKQFTYRDKAEEFSNRYHLSGTTPADAAAWKTLYNAIIAAEQQCVPNNVIFARAYGYAPGVDHAVDSFDYLNPTDTAFRGNLAVGTGIRGPGDAAAMVRWTTPNLTSTGKKIYLRKYWHNVLLNPADGDELYTAQKTGMAAYAATMIDGSLPGGRKYCGPQGAVASNPVVAAYVTTRTLKRRGKRPPTAA